MEQMPLLLFFVRGVNCLIVQSHSLWSSPYVSACLLSYFGFLTGVHASLHAGGDLLRKGRTSISPWGPAAYRPANCHFSVMDPAAKAVTLQPSQFRLKLLNFSALCGFMIARSTPKDTRGYLASFLLGARWKLIISFTKKKKIQAKVQLMFCSPTAHDNQAMSTWKKGYIVFYTIGTIWLLSCLPKGHALFLIIHLRQTFSQLPKGKVQVSGGFPSGVHKFSYKIHSHSSVFSLSLKLTLILTSEFSMTNLFPHFKVWEQEE